jgi:DNA polymerase
MTRTHEQHAASQELRDLVAAFRIHLAWREAHGLKWVSAAPSPRFISQAESSTRVVDAPVPLAPSSPLALAAAAPPPPKAACPPAVGPDASSTTTTVSLSALREELGSCQRCALAQGRRQLIFGEGPPRAELMLIGEAPDSEEDRQGQCFVGPAGELLLKMLRAMGLEREEVYYATLVKCHPPRNRSPHPEEARLCEPFLRRQIAALAPKIILALGSLAAQRLLRSDLDIVKLRGRFQRYQEILLMPTFHPAYLLQNPEHKRPVWQDLQAVMAKMDELGLKRRR